MAAHTHQHTCRHGAAALKGDQGVEVSSLLCIHCESRIQRRRYDRVVPTVLIGSNSITFTQEILPGRQGSLFKFHVELSLIYTHLSSFVHYRPTFKEPHKIASGWNQTRSFVFIVSRQLPWNNARLRPHHHCSCRDLYSLAVPEISQT